jgi:Pyruvate/2-oxoacid:ferredoxin oxidoreductase delta subunit
MIVITLPGHARRDDGSSDVAEDRGSQKITRRPAIDADRCVDCGSCVGVCPNDAIQEPMNFCCAKCVKYCLTMDVPCRPGSVVVCLERCDGCGTCVSACPHEAIAWSEPGDGRGAGASTPPGAA